MLSLHSPVLLVCPVSKWLAVTFKAERLNQSMSKLQFVKWPVEGFKTTAETNTGTCLLWLEETLFKSGLFELQLRAAKSWQFHCRFGHIYYIIIIVVVVQMWANVNLLCSL